MNDFLLNRSITTDLRKLMLKKLRIGHTVYCTLVIFATFKTVLTFIYYVV